MTLFTCPVCGEMLTKEDRLYRCPAGHSFDRAKSGYVNLLTPDKMNSSNPGDSKEMVLSRRDFLLGGHYEPLKKALSETAKKYAPPSPVYLDAGCGTGYYMKGVAEETEAMCALGVDISKNAVNVTAKYFPCETAVASVYSLPLCDESVDIITNVFSPMADKEYLRVLKKGGYLLYVVPAPEHLFSLKTLLYEKPYLNTEEDIFYEGFEAVERIGISFDLNLTSPEEILSLFRMTPYFWRTPEGAEDKIRIAKTLQDKASFYILVFKK
ncbi:MAG: methyltransferase domain-containing protein [Clostridia bacterium]|nr:methyltransferase domain-containing protein [Clostridia bacterium]